MRNLLTLVPAAMLLAGCNGDHSELQRESAEDPHAGHDMSASGEDMTPAQEAFAMANARMHAAMDDIPPDADEAFMRGMLAHHRGAVEMSEVELEYGTQEQARDLARRVIEAQQAEIEEIEAWLADRGRATE